MPKTTLNEMFESDIKDLMVDQQYHIKELDVTQYLLKIAKENQFKALQSVYQEQVKIHYSYVRIYDERIGAFRERLRFEVC